MQIAADMPGRMPDSGPPAFELGHASVAVGQSLLLCRRLLGLLKIEIRPQDCRGIAGRAGRLRLTDRRAETRCGCALHLTTLFLLGT